MPKRKRSADSSISEAFEKHQIEIFRALKSVKGFERQRQSKRLRQNDVSPEKRQRIEREIAVLKSLDLHEIARTHLISSLLRIDAVASSPDLPQELRHGVPQPEVSELDRNALHNVTSSLYSQDLVRQRTDNAVAALCAALHVPVPEKRKRLRKQKRAEAEGQPAERKTDAQTKTEPVAGDAVSDDESVFEGFGTDIDEAGHLDDSPEGVPPSADEMDFSTLDNLIGGSSDEELDDDRLDKYRGTESVNLDDISLSGSSDDEDDALSDSQSSSTSSPHPTKQKKRDENRPVAAAPRLKDAEGSTFLPSLMGGYISGSESVSDIEDAKPQKRRGQRARQAIWEKKYGASAKHLQKGSQTRGRDAGWDMKRGAVDAEGRDRKSPWKKGISGPLARSANAAQTGVASPHGARPRPPPKWDDQGSLHPSWAAKKQAQEAQKKASFSGQKIVFE